MNSFAIINSFPELDESRRRLFEESSVAMHEIDTEGVIRTVNQAECQLLGFEPHELVGHHVWEFLVPEQREDSRNAIAKKVSRELPISLFMREVRRADGSYLWVEVHENLIVNAGQIIGIRSGLFDITERRKFEMEIRDQHNRMKWLLRSWKRAIISADALGHVEFMNPAAEALTGWPQKDALGRPLETICRVLPDGGEATDLITSILREAPICNQTMESVIVDRFGARHNVSWTTSPITNDDGVIMGAALVFEKRQPTDG
jgi:PAS domain S-box-containing protein